DLSAHVLEWGGIVAASAYVIGGINLVQVTWPKIRRREADWQYKVVLLAAAAIMGLAGLPWRSLYGTREPGSIETREHHRAAETRGRAVVMIDAPDDVVVSVGATTTTAASSSVDVWPGELSIKAGKRVVGYDTFETKTTLAPGDVIVIHADPQMRWGADG